MPLPTSPNTSKADHQPKKTHQVDEESVTSLPTLEGLSRTQPPSTPVNSSTGKRKIAQPKPDHKAELNSKKGPLTENLRIDPKTGVKYQVIPKTVMDTEGRPISQIEDFNVDDLNSEADRFLGHLRIAPTPEELAQLREERKARIRESREKDKIER
jgi:hypothetical protein